MRVETPLLVHKRIPRYDHQLHGSEEAHRTRIECYEIDAKVKRKRSPTKDAANPSGVPHARGATGQKRGTVTKHTSHSASRLRHLIRNQTRIKGFATLTYPPALAPKSKDELKRHMDRFQRGLKRAQAAAIIVREINGEGVPHFHLLLDRVFQTQDLLEIWRAAIQADPEDALCVDSQLVYDRLNLAKYLSKSGLAKPKGSGGKDDHLCQEVDPFGGRWWTATGGMGKLDVLAVVEGPVAEMAAAVRNAKRLEKGRSRERLARNPQGKRYKRKDGGLVGFTCSGLSKALRRAYPYWAKKDEGKPP